VVTVALNERLAPVVTKYGVLVGAEDADFKRWTGKLEQSQSRSGQLRSSLAVLDDPKAVITEADLDRLALDLASLTAIVGDQDAGVRGWSAKITSGRENISRLRKNLTRLDAVELATTALQAALKQDLASLTTLVDANDPDLKRWTRKIADSVSRIASLRKSLSRLDQPANLTVDEQKLYADQLTSFRALVSADDGQLQAWSARLRAEESNLATLHEVLQASPAPGAHDRARARCQHQGPRRAGQARRHAREPAPAGRAPHPGRAPQARRAAGLPAHASAGRSGRPGRSPTTSP
jgi:succinate dehydrogenase flavin-adding protein (antitoxin of CptAB toxin-antitoxin module)